MFRDQNKNYSSNTSYFKTLAGKGFHLRCWHGDRGAPQVPSFLPARLPRHAQPRTPQGLKDPKPPCRWLTLQSCTTDGPDVSHTGATWQACETKAKKKTWWQCGPPTAQFIDGRRRFSSNNSVRGPLRTPTAPLLPWQPGEGQVQEWMTWSGAQFSFIALVRP